MNKYIKLKPIEHDIKFNDLLYTAKTNNNEVGWYKNS